MNEEEYREWGREAFRMRACVINDGLLGYSLVSPDVGRFASFFDSEADAVMYAERNGIEIF